MRLVVSARAAVVVALLTGELLLLPGESRSADAPIATPVISKVTPGISQVALEWSSVSGATSYNVYYDPTSGKASTSSVPAQSGISGTKTVVLGLDSLNEKLVYFAVRAVMAGTPSSSSMEISTTPSVKAEPSDVVLTPSRGQISLSWTPIGATSYEIDVGTDYRSLSPVLTGISGNVATVTALGKDSPLKSGTTYFFQVKAISGANVAESPVLWSVLNVSGKTSASCILTPGSGVATHIAKMAKDSGTESFPAELETSNETGTDVLSKFSTTATSGSTQASAQIVRGYINSWIKRDSKENCGLTNAISVEVSATAPLNTATFADYAREEMLGRRGGLVNIYFNPFSGRDSNNPYYNWSDRKLNSDHVYIAGPFQTFDAKLRREPDVSSNIFDQALSFYSFGIGGRGVKTALQGSTTAAVGTVYFGYGIDGPFHDTTATLSPNSTPASQSGGVSFETYVTGNIANRNTLNTMFATSDASSFYNTFGASITFWVTGKLFFSLEYDKGFGSFGQRVLRDESLFRFGYGNPSSPASPPPSKTNANSNANASPNAAPPS
jgi:hypothetical protein